MPTIDLFSHAFQVHDEKYQGREEKYRLPSNSFKVKANRCTTNVSTRRVNQVPFSLYCRQDFTKENDSAILFLFQLQNVGVLVRDNLLGL